MLYYPALMSTTSFFTQQLAQGIIDFQIKTATDIVKYKLEKEIFFEEAIEHLMYDNWTEDQKERWLERHLELFDFN